jgi:adenylate cyclase, class 1
VLAKTLLRNKQTFARYMRFRKTVFAELAPRDSEVILQLLPWLLSVNEPACPGYVERLKQPFRVYRLEQDRETLTREPAFKRRFDVRKDGSLLRHATPPCLIHGVYTVGSVGTVAQTAGSDCDTWIVIDRRDFDDTAMRQLRQKVNLIKDWLDGTMKLPVFFFICDVDDVRCSRFGRIDYQSCGSAQKNVMKEEFYRTGIVIAGKVPFWWVCHEEGDAPVDYEAAWQQAAASDEGDMGFVDFGDLQSVDREEYFGAVLWQFNKALTHPLKSIVKMLLLQTFCDAPAEGLLCRRLREKVLADEPETDPSLFTMEALFAHYAGRDSENFGFIKQCFYLRHDLKLLSRKVGVKERLAGDLFLRYQLPRVEIYRLNEFTSWTLQQQMAFGNRLFDLLLKIYRDIDAVRMTGADSINPEDLTILGRKLSACLSPRDHKLPLIHKAMEIQHHQTLILSYKGRVWRVSTADDPGVQIVANANLIYCLAYLVWNDMIGPGRLRMLPNPTSVTMQEITNLCGRIRDIFGINNITAVDFGNFLEEEQVRKALVVVSFEQETESTELNDLCLIYLNNWGELFIRRFPGAATFKGFFKRLCIHSSPPELHYYIQRSSLYYEKIIERTKRLVAEILAG